MLINSFAKKASDILETITAVPLIIMGGAMVVIVFTGTISRYVFNNPFLWTEEASRYLMIWIALVGASIALKRKEHVTMQIVVSKFSPNIQRIIRLIVMLFILYFLYVLTERGYIMAIKSQRQASPALNISMFWPLISVPVCGLLTSIQAILQIIIDITEIGDKQ
ncbi:MAG: TRAP transporter small permease [Actinomycetota bacterium]|nr:TRAP transporter small permease [Actinomycetota bacterium]